VAETRRIEDFDATLVRFENGVRLTVKPTKYRADQVLVTATIAGGRLMLPKDRVTFNTGAYIGGGLEAMNFFDLRRELATKIFSVGFGIDDDAFAFSGGTRPADLDTQLQVLVAYMTKPGWRPEAFQQGLTATSNALAQRDSTATSVFGARLGALLRSGDIRWAPAESADVAKAKLEDVKSVLAPALTNGPIEITIVGDITVDQAVKSVAATFGAIPQRSGPAMTPPAMGEVKFPAANTTPMTLTHNGRSDQSMAFIGWPTTDAFADGESAARRLVTDIVQTRLMEQLREKDGATYSPQATAQASLTFPGYGYIAAFAELPPQKTQLFYDTIGTIVADLRDHGPNADELERARKPEIDGLTRAMVTNAFWQSGLSGIQTDERRLKLIRDALPQLQNVTAADVQRVAQKYLTDARAFKVMVLPKTP
jgi:zinc protease